MSCLNGTDCQEPAKRRRAIVVLGLMLAIFVGLSILSFLPSHKQAIPSEVQHNDTDAVLGKRVFQAYNCMGCHTIVGNGAYFGPDLTHLYASVGPAWLGAFLPSAGGWPTSAAVQVQLQNTVMQQASGTADIQEYLKQYPGAAKRVEQRGGQHTLMPNLPLDATEISALIAFMKYTASMDTEGWPPKPKEGRRIPAIAQASAASIPTASTAAGTPDAASAAADTGADPVALGKQLVNDLGCVACHASDQKRLIGPGWGGLAGSTVKLADGTTVTADDDYLIEAIRQPDAKIAEGYPPNVMPSYDALINESDMKAIVAYLRSL